MPWNGPVGKTMAAAHPWPQRANAHRLGGVSCRVPRQRQPHRNLRLAVVLRLRRRIGKVLAPPPLRVRSCCAAHACHTQAHDADAKIDMHIACCCASPHNTHVGIIHHRLHACQVNSQVST